MATNLSISQLIRERNKQNNRWTKKFFSAKHASKNTRFDFFNLKTEPLKNKGLRPKQKKTIVIKELK
jgi:hypothetical protein